MYINLFVTQHTGHSPFSLIVSEEIEAEVLRLWPQVWFFFFFFPFISFNSLGFFSLNFFWYKDSVHPSFKVSGLNE